MQGPPTRATSTVQDAPLGTAGAVVGESRARWALRLCGRMAGRLLGLLLLVAGIAKAIDPMRFAQEIADYGIITQIVVTGIVAYAIVIIECGLGMALLVNLRPRISLALTAVLLVVFIVAVGWAWSSGATADCGCFGPWKRTPRQAFVEDVVLIALIPWAWWGRRLTHAPTNVAKIAAVGLGIAIGITTPAIAGVSEGPGAGGSVGSDAFRSIDVKDLAVPLATGDHLVLLMSTTCPHCQEAVPSANALFEDQRLPKLVAIAMNDRVERGLFRQDYHAEYPIGEISQQAVYSLLKKDFPRLFLVHDGRIVAVWDTKMPSGEEILEKQANAPPSR